jgi:hypothetical protein
MCYDRFKDGLICYICINFIDAMILSIVRAQITVANLVLCVFSFDFGPCVEKF